LRYAEISLGAKTLNYLLLFSGPVKISLQQGQDILSILKLLFEFFAFPLES
jgi:transcriptional regulator